MNTFENIELAIKTLKEEEISYIYEKGKIILKEDFIHLAQILNYRT